MINEGVTFYFTNIHASFQYIHPTDAVKLGQAELLVIDEAAAIPLPQVKELIAGMFWLAVSCQYFVTVTVKQT